MLPLLRGGNWTRLLVSNRVLLLALLTLAIGIPELVHPWFGSGRLFVAEPGAVEVSLVASVVALVAAHMSLRHMSYLPLVTARLLILPTFIATYAVTIVSLYALNVPLAPYHFWTSFGVGAAFFGVVSILRARLVRPVIGLFGLPSYFREELPGNIRWINLVKPELRCPVAAVVVDPHAELDLECSKFLTDLVLHGIPVYHRSHLEEGLSGRVRFRTYADNNFGALLPSLAYLRLKRGIDLIVAILALPLIVMVLAITAVAIKLDSPGPVIYRQARRGFRGKEFLCYKLRSMRHAEAGPAYTTANDRRVTRVGKVIRKWRIDELPQVFNIIRGEMSWIGPRPEAVELAESYAAAVPFYDYRHAVRPGITGWAAVHQGNVALVDAARAKLEYDFYYIKYFSIWLDFLTALKTVHTVLTGFGSR